MSDLIAFLRQVYTMEGTEAAVQAAKDMISAGAAWIAQEHGPDEALRIIAPYKGKSCPDPGLRHCRLLRGVECSRDCNGARRALASDDRQ
jgi:hypothetical protein